MQKEPILVVLAAGLGSRYGGLKQLDGIDEDNNKIISYSVFDAYRAGFKRVVFIIKHEIEKMFKEQIGNTVEKFMEVIYVYQELYTIPSGYELNKERKKPLGTGHALWCAKEYLDAPFAIINSDDFYGFDAYSKIYKFLSADPKTLAMVAYPLVKTLSKSGSVARGVCVVDGDYLVNVDERTKIVLTKEGPAYLEDDIAHLLNVDDYVSMNFWGFIPSVLEQLDIEFKEFLKSFDYFNEKEFYIPVFVKNLITTNKQRVKVYHSDDEWFGVTYKEDKPYVVQKIKELKQEGKYPERIWK